MDKDWGDFIRLGTAGGEGRVLSQGPQKARTNPYNIATLPHNWTTYISQREVVPAIQVAPV